MARASSSSAAAVLEAPAPPGSPESRLHDAVADYYADPLGFVLHMYPWGEPGPLQHHPGPDAWQGEFLEWIGRGRARVAEARRTRR